MNYSILVATLLVFLLSACTGANMGGYSPMKAMNAMNAMNPMNSMNSMNTMNAMGCSCHLSELEKCSAPLLQLSALIVTGSFPDPASEFKAMCSKLAESKECRNKYYLKCAPPQLRDSIHRFMFYESDLNSDRLCSNYSLLYETKAKCLHSVKDLTQACSTKLKPTYEADKSKQIKNTCRMMNEMLDCTHTVIRDNCGAESIDLMEALSKAFGTNSAKTICELYTDKQD